MDTTNPITKTCREPYNQITAELMSDQWVRQSGAKMNNDKLC